MGIVTQVQLGWKNNMHHQEYKIVTLNVNGLHNPIKMSKIKAIMTQEKLLVTVVRED